MKPGTCGVWSAWRHADDTLKQGCHAEPRRSMVGRPLRASLRQAQTDVFNSLPTGGARRGGVMGGRGFYAR